MIQRKYLLTPADQTIFGRPMFRVQALRPIPEHRVKAGEFGGLIESEANLSQAGACWIGGDAIAFEGARITDDALASGHAVIRGYATLKDKATALDFSRAEGQSIIRDRAQLRQNAMISGQAILSGNLSPGSFTALTEDQEYIEHDDLPWSLADHAEEDALWIERLREAADLDAALSSLMALIGPESATQRQELIDHLLTAAHGKRTLRRLSAALGGKFLPTTYLPRTCWDQTASRAARAQSLAEQWRIVGAMLLCWLDSLEDDTEFCAGVFRYQSDRSENVFYQPAILRQSAPVGAVPLPMSILPIAASYQSLPEAISKARRAVAQLNHTDEDEPSHWDGGARQFSTNHHRPVLLDAEVEDGGLRLHLQSNDPGEPRFARLLIEDDLKNIANLAFITKAIFNTQGCALDPLRAARTLHHATLKLPAPSRELADLLKTAARADQNGSIIMQRDMDLVRSILFEIERNENINGRFIITDTDLGELGADRNAVQYHLRLLMDAGYIEGQDTLKTPLNIYSDNSTFSVEAGNRTPDATMRSMTANTGAAPITINRMTWQGHEFLDTVRDNKVWQKTKGYLKDFGGVSIDVLKDVAKAVVKDQIKQYTGINLS